MIEMEKSVENIFNNWNEAGTFSGVFYVTGSERHLGKLR
jgi:hypothetical protein